MTNKSEREAPSYSSVVSGAAWGCGQQSAAPREGCPLALVRLWRLPASMGQMREDAAT